MQSRSGLMAALTAGALLVASSPSGARIDSLVRRVPITPSSLLEQQRAKPLPHPRESENACIAADKIAGAVVADERSIEITLTNGQLWLMRFAEDCSALSYYEGFYYRPKEAGRLCAGRDEVIARSGGACRVKALSRLRGSRSMARAPR